MPPSVCLPPLEFCRGVSPSHAAKSRPDLNTLGSGVEAVITEAISLPTPGTLASKRFISLRAWASAICPSRSPIAFLDNLKNSGQRLNGGLGGVGHRCVYFGQLEQFVDAADSLGDDNTEFGKMATQRIDANSSRVLCSISVACCSALLIGTSASRGATSLRRGLMSALKA